MSDRWTEREYAFLRDNYARLSDGELAKRLRRPKASIVRTAKILGLRRPAKQWSDEELQYVRDNYLYMDYGEIAAKLGRTRESVQRKILKMGLRKTDCQARLTKKTVPADEGRLASLRLRLCRVADLCSDCVKGWGVTEDTPQEEIASLERMKCAPCMYSHESRKLIDEIDALEAAVREERKKRRKRA